MRTEGARWEVALVSLALAVSGCEAGAAVYVDVVTNYDVGADFDRVETSLVREGETAAWDTVSYDPAPGARFTSGVRVAELLSVPPGVYRVEARLMRGAEAVASQRTSAMVGSNLAISLAIVRPPCVEGEERCDGVDNDCDGEIDEGEPAALCPLAHAGDVSCEAGSCALTSCEAGWDSCDGEAATGCESDLRSSRESCGECEVVCTANDTCDDGRCRGMGAYVGDAAIDAFGDRFQSVPTPEGFVTWVLRYDGPPRIVSLGHEIGERWRWSGEGLDFDPYATGRQVGPVWAAARVSVDPTDGRTHVVFPVENRGSASTWSSRLGEVSVGRRGRVWLDLPLDEEGREGPLRHLPGVDTTGIQVTAGGGGAYTVVGLTTDGGFVAAGVTWESGRVEADGGFFSGAATGAREHVIRFSAEGVPLWEWAGAVFDGELAAHRWVFGSTPEMGEAAFQVSPAGAVLATTSFSFSGVIDLGDGPLTVEEGLALVAVFARDGELVHQQRSRGTIRAVFRPDGGTTTLFTSSADDEVPVLVEHRDQDGALTSSFELPPRVALWAPFAVGPTNDLYVAQTLSSFPIDFGGGLRRPLLRTAVVAAYSEAGAYRFDRVDADPGSVGVLSLAVNGDRLLLGVRLIGGHDFGGGLRESDGGAWLALLRD